MDAPSDDIDISDSGDDENGEEDMEESESADAQADEDPSEAPLPKKRRKNKSCQVRACCVRRCRSRVSRRRRDDDVWFHAFPKPDDKFFRDVKWINRRDEWVRVLGIEADVAKQLYVCSRHFQPDNYHVPDGGDKRRSLKMDAVPSLNLPELPRKVSPPKRLHMVWVPAHDEVSKAPCIRLPVPSKELSCPEISSALAKTRGALKKVIKMKASRPPSDSVHGDAEKETAVMPPQDRRLVTVKTEETNVGHRGPSKESQFREGYISPDGPPPHEQDEFTVDENCLLELFRQCSTCRAACSVALVADGNQVMVTAICSNAHQRSWTNVQ